MTLNILVPRLTELQNIGQRLDILSPIVQKELRAEFVFKNEQYKIYENQSKVLQAKINEANNEVRKLLNLLNSYEQKPSHTEKPMDDDD